MEDIRYVIEELNRAPFLKGYNLLAYDALRSDQRLDLLIELLNTIDPKLALSSVRGGSGVAIEDTVATILEQLRIFKFRVPFEYGSSTNDVGSGLGPGTDFRRDLLVGDKDLHTFLLKWLFERAGALKKRAYLARFLVKIEVPPELEGDHDVVTLYQQYHRTIEEFKRSHAASETQKKALDALIELQRDIHSMELERDQAKAKLETVKRRVDITSNSTASKLFETARKWALARAESDKLARQAQEQNEKMNEIKRQLEVSRAKLLEHRASNNVEHITGNGLIEQLKDEITIQRRGVGTFLPAELERLRSTVEDMETIAASGENEAVLNDYLSRIEKQIGVFETEIRQLLDKKLMTLDDDQNGNQKDVGDRKAAHYRRNAEAIVAKRERIQAQVNKAEAFLREEEHRLNEIREGILQSNNLDDMRGEALNVALERWTNREVEMQLRAKELKQYENEAKELEAKANELHAQDTNISRSIVEQEDQLSIGGYFSMKELTLLEQPVENDPDGDGLEGIEAESAASVEVLNTQISRFQSIIEKIRSQLGPLVRDVKQQKQQLNEMESEFGMKKRLYESAAAGLEADISLQERSLETASSEARSLNDQLQAQKTQQTISEGIRDWFVSDAETIVSGIQQQLQAEQAELNILQQKQDAEADDESKRQQKSSQIEMWRNVGVLLEIKSRILQKQNKKSFNQTAANSSDGTYNHLVL